MTIESTMSQLQAVHENVVDRFREIENLEEQLAESNALLRAYLRFAAEVSRLRAWAVVRHWESNDCSPSELAKRLSVTEEEVERLVRIFNSHEAEVGKVTRKPARRPGRPNKLGAEELVAAQVALDDGHSVEQVASMFQVSRATVYRVLRPKRLRRPSKRPGASPPTSGPRRQVSAADSR